MFKRKKHTLQDEATQQKSLRLWPGVIAMVLLLFLRFGILIFIPEAVIIGVLGTFLCALAILVWWAFFSRVPRSERLGVIVLIFVALGVTWPLLHESMRLMPFFIYTIPVVCIVFVIWAVALSRLPIRTRRIALVIILVLVCGVWTLIRTGGVSSDFNSDFAWRWSETPEQKLLAQSDDEQMVLPSSLLIEESDANWPGFRGPNRDGIVYGAEIETNWSEFPPIELWRKAIGPGWSSFAVSSGLFYTQEQRGADEIVSCYIVSTGQPVWKHRDATRFWESNSGAGPRGTPTLSNGRVYTLGATGILNVLDAIDGSLIWSRNAATDADTKVPTWGFSGSPLVFEDVVIVALAGSLIAYDPATGEPRWTNYAGGDCYSSPHPASIDGVEQILLQNEAGIISVTPAEGSLLWEYSWSGQPIVQPALISDGKILISADERSGVRLITATQGNDGWTIEEHWSSSDIKPYFNDSIIHNGHVYGFDGLYLSCIDMNDGTFKWSGGRYNRGQFILLANQDLLIVISEKGELGLVKASSDEFVELTRFQAIEGKTWNHPVLVDNILLVRNAEEMAAFQLSLVQN